MSRNTFRPSVLQVIIFVFSRVGLFTGQSLYARFHYGINATPADLSFFETGAVYGSVLILASIGGLVRWRDLQLGQVARDARASEIMRVLDLGGVPQPYSMYLRTFGVTDQLGVSYKENKLLSTADPEDHRDLETLLAEALEAFQPLIALGQPNEHLGAGRVLTDDELWQVKIERLLHNAKLIVMIPSHRPGTKWEVEWLVTNGMLTRALFLMPPSDSFTRSDAKQSWETACAELSKFGLSLPAYSKRGCLFQTDDKGQTRAVRELPKKVTPAAISNLIRDLTMPSS